MELTQADLNGFYGTANWYRHPLCKTLIYTDGVQFLGEKGAYWLIDAIASYQREIARRGGDMLRNFQLWELMLNDGKDDKGAKLTCRADTDVKPFITQEIPYTDFPFSIKLYVEGDVQTQICLMLQSER